MAHDWKNVMLLNEKEITLLRDARDPPSVIWTWIAAQIGRYAADGLIPPMPTPTYGRIMNLCQQEHGGIRQVRANICVQTPWNYAHFLAMIVHLNNILNAVSLGMTGGVALATALQSRFGMFEHRASAKQAERDAEDL